MKMPVEKDLDCGQLFLMPLDSLSSPYRDWPILCSPCPSPTYGTMMYSPSQKRGHGEPHRQRTNYELNLLPRIGGIPWTKSSSTPESTLINNLLDDMTSTRSTQGDNNLEPPTNKEEEDKKILVETSSNDYGVPTDLAQIKLEMMEQVSEPSELQLDLLEDFITDDEERKKTWKWLMNQVESMNLDDIWSM